MHVFISYSRHDTEAAERLKAALNVAGFEIFYDKRDLPPGEEFNRKIVQALAECDLLVFLASEYSLRPGGYARTELAFAESKWPNPNGFVLPVLVGSCFAENLPVYLRSITAVSPGDNAEARVVAWVESRVESGGARPRDLLNHTDRLRRWVATAQPPLREVGAKVPISAIRYLITALFLFGFGCASLNFDTHWNSDNPPGSSLGSMPWYMTWHPWLWIAAAACLVYAFIKLNEGLSGAPEAVAVVILEQKDQVVDLETSDGRRLSLEPAGINRIKVFPGELGWAYISGSTLMDFVRASAAS